MKAEFKNFMEVLVKGCEITDIQDIDEERQSCTLILGTDPDTWIHVEVLEAKFRHRKKEIENE